jgi:hypothetical protein
MTPPSPPVREQRPRLKPSPTSIFRPAETTTQSALTVRASRGSFGPEINEVVISLDSAPEPQGCEHIFRTVGDGTAANKRCQACGWQPGLPATAAQVTASRPAGSEIARLWGRR